jgi:hypothetical protein
MTRPLVLSEGNDVLDRRVCFLTVLCSVRASRRPLFDIIRWRAIVTGLRRGDRRSRALGTLRGSFRC